MEFDNIETIKRAVEIGQGVAIVPRSTVELEISRGSLKLLEFNEGPFTRPLAIIYKRGRELSPAVRKFIEVLTTSKLPMPGHTGRSLDGKNSEAYDRPQNSERSERNDRGERLDRAERSEKIEKTAQSH
jgi:hypothetical protein